MKLAKCGFQDIAVNCKHRTKLGKCLLTRYAEITQKSNGEMVIRNCPLPREERKKTMVEQ